MRALHHGGASAPGLAVPERLHVSRHHDLVPMGAGAGGLAHLSPAHKDEAHRLAGTAGFRDQSTTGSTHCAEAAAVNQDGGVAKRQATLQARAALAGFELASTPDGSFCVSRCGLIRALADAVAVDAFLKQVNA